MTACTCKLAADVKVLEGNLMSRDLVNGLLGLDVEQAVALRSNGVGKDVLGIATASDLESITGHVTKH